MFGLVAALISLAVKAWGWLYPKPPGDESVQALAKDKGTDTVTIHQKQAANDQLTKVLDARNTADVDSVQHDPAANQVHTDPSASINRLPGEYLRD